LRPGVVGTVGAFMLLTVRGFLLWLVIPFGTLAWGVSLQALRTPAVSLGAYLGWIDNNIAFLLVNGPFSLSFPHSPVRWVASKDRAAVKHRIGFTDLL